jgi:hypothetical protein
MDPAPEANKGPEPEEDKTEPVRHRYGDLVEEARIAKAGGGVARISPLYQALIYLMLVSALALAIYFSWTQ